VIWLLAISLLAMLSLVGFVVRLTLLVAQDRRRWRDRRARFTLLADPPANSAAGQGLGTDGTAKPPAKPPEGDAVEFVQNWLDHEWEQRFG
jgi:hypothetical protein